MSSRTLKLIDVYLTSVAKGDIEVNPKQEHILHLLESCWKLHKRRFRLPWEKKQLKTPSIYLYGTVGSGKTFVMNLFFQALPTTKKVRFHFHDFIEDISLKLQALQGHLNPMTQIVNELVSQYEVICLDEMMVQDVVQAMLLVELVPALLAKKVMLVMTSNIEPSLLYLNGLQRQRFLQVIECIEQYMHVVQLSSHKDYRAGRYPMPQRVYFNAHQQEDFQKLFYQYVNHFQQLIEPQNVIELQQRQVVCIAQTSSMIWFDYQDIGTIPRCQRDYLELTKKYQMVFIQNLEPLAEDDVAKVILWMYLIDVLYDARVKLIILAKVSMDKLYPKGPMTEPFKRTLSRMKEMQSKWYWEG